MMNRYEMRRGAKKRQRFLIYYEGEFGTLPFEIMSSGPWTDIRQGDVCRLDMRLRLRLAKQGWILLDDMELGFTPEARPERLKLAQ